MINNDQLTARFALTRNFAGNGMRLSDLVAPVSSANGNDGQLGEDDGTTNGGRHLGE